MLRASVPYMRESFVREVDLIPFDANFNLMDANLFSGNAQTKGLHDIRLGIDSLRHVSDSTAHAIAASTMGNYLNKSLPTGMSDSARIVKECDKALPLDSAYARLTDEQRTSAWRTAQNRAESLRSEYDFRAIITADVNMSLRRHRMEEQKKFTLSLACLLFFFIGAPLGAIIRKGGLGVPVIISVLVFIVYYIFDNTGYRMARGGMWAVWFGKSIATAVLAPLAVFFTYKANKDSVVFNIDLYRNFFMKLLGLRNKRAVYRKDVIINDPDYAADAQSLLAINADIDRYVHEHNLLLAPNFVKVFFKYAPDHEVEQMTQLLEQVIEDLSNTKDRQLLAALNDYPFMTERSHTRPFERRWLNVLAALVVPLGLFLYLRMWHFRLRLLRDFRLVRKLNEQVVARIEDMNK